jgi:hypothetical protein
VFNEVCEMGFCSGAVDAVFHAHVDLKTVEL